MEGVLSPSLLMSRGPQVPYEDEGEGEEPEDDDEEKEGVYEVKVGDREGVQTLRAP